MGARGVAGAVSSVQTRAAQVHEKGVPKYGVIGNLDFGKDPALGETKDAGGRAKNKSYAARLG